MPQVRALGLERGVREQRRTDHTTLDRTLGRLQPGTEDRVGSGTDPETRGSRAPQQCIDAVSFEADRLLRPHVLPRRDRRRGHLHVRGGNGEVHDDLHIGVGQDIVSGPPLRNAVLLRLRASPLDVQVADDHDFDVREGAQVLQVGVADDTAADQADADRAHRTNPPSRRNARLAATSSKTSPGGLSYSMTA